MGFLQHLWRWLQKQIPQRNGGRTPSLILTLPLDVVLLILDRLTEPDKFPFSQTYQVIRRLTLRDQVKEIRQLPRHDWFDLFAGLADSLPNRFVCTELPRLHTIGDIELHVSRRDTQFDRPLWCCGTLHISCDEYSVQHHNMELALKFAQLSNANQRYLKRLMAPYFHKRYRGGHTLYSQRLLTADLSWAINGYLATVENLSHCETSALTALWYAHMSPLRLVLDTWAAPGRRHTHLLLNIGAWLLGHLKPQATRWKATVLAVLWTILLSFRTRPQRRSPLKPGMT